MRSILCPSCECPDCAIVGPIPDSSRFAGTVLTEAIPGGSLYTCRQCALWFRYPRLPKRALDCLYALGSANVWARDASLRADWDGIKSVLHELVPSGRVLDVGCFDGELLSGLGPAYALFGVELNAKAAELARRRGITLLQPDFEDLRCCDQRFDAIIATDVVEHTYDPSRFLRDCARLLAPRGILLMSTGTTDAWTWRLMKGGYWYCVNAEHVSFVNEAWVRKVCSQLLLDEVCIRRFAHDKSLSLCVKQTLLNVAYRLSPRALAAVKRALARDPLTRERPELRNAPPSWSTAKDHMLFALRARG